MDGVLEMFQRSVELHNVYYENYAGDGDTTTFKNLKDESPYGEELQVNKMECVLHVKKRMYKRARDAKKNLTQMKKTQKTLHDEEEKRTTSKRNAKDNAVTSRARKNPKPKVKTAAFANKVILELSTYYELAIR